MEMYPVSSSNLVAVGYEPTTQELTIQFLSGVYTYVGVPQHIYNGLLSSHQKEAITINTLKIIHSVTDINSIRVLTLTSQRSFVQFY